MKKIVIGKIFTNWCIHCKMLNPEWEKMKKKVKLQMGRHLKNTMIEYCEIEGADDTDETSRILQEKVEQKYGVPPVNFQGFPTLFKIVGNNISYYEGDRTADALYKWAVSGSVFPPKRRRVFTRKMPKMPKRAYKKNRTARNFLFF